MDGQHQYEINLKKDDLFISLESDDVYFISKQMDKWFSILLDDSYVPVSMPQRTPVAESVPVQPIPQPLPMPQEAIAQPMPQPLPMASEAAFIHPAQAQVPQVQPQPTAETNEQLAQQLMAQTMQQQQAQQQVIPQPQVMPQELMQQPQPQMIQPQPQPQMMQPQPTLQDVLEQVGQPNLPAFVAQQAPAQPSVLGSMPAQPAAATYQDVNLPMAQAPVQQHPMPQAMPVQPVYAPPVEQAPLPAVEAIPQPAMAAPQPEVQPQSMPQPIPQPQPVAVGAPALVANGDQDDFEAVMNSLLRDFDDRAPEPPGFAADGGQRERVEPDLAGVTSLADLCDRSNAANSEDYLLLSAYYLTRLERQDTFSLKKVNSVLVKSGLTPVNHSVLETVLSNGYLSMLPDLTGTAEVTEYQISSEGVEAAIALL